jgi:GNAT superfamily N-acetyltransferase
MSNVIVRQAGLSEIDQVAALFDLYRQFYGKETNLHEVRKFLLNRFNHGESVIFIAYINQNPVGFTQLYPSFSSVSLGRTFVLNDLYVIAEAREQGVARSLIEYAKIHAKTLGAIRLSLSTAITNTIAQKVYEANGWEKDVQFLVYQYQINS